MAAVEHFVDPNMMAFMVRVAGVMAYYVSSAAMPEMLAVATSVAGLVEEEMARLRLWLVMGDMDCAKRLGRCSQAWIHSERRCAGNRRLPASCHLLRKRKDWTTT